MQKILIVEDNPVNRRILENNVRAIVPDAEIVTVNNGSEAIFYYLTNSFDLVFLDILMPKINGYHFLTIIEDNIKAGHINHSANIIVQTGIQSLIELNALSGKEIVRDLIRKPITKQQIRECIDMYC